LEFNTVVWSPSLKCDISSVEKVQRKFTKGALHMSDRAVNPRHVQRALSVSQAMATLATLSDARS